MPEDIEFANSTVTVSQEAYDNAEDYTPVPPGRYLCKCKGAQTGDKDGNPLISTKGKRKWQLIFYIVQHDKNALQGYEGKRITDSFWLTMDAMEKRGVFVCKRMGVPIVGGQCESKDFADKLVRLDIDIDVYVGDDGEEKPYNNVHRTKANGDDAWDTYHRYDPNETATAETETDSKKEPENDMPF